MLSSLCMTILEPETQTKWRLLEADGRVSRPPLYCRGRVPMGVRDLTLAHIEVDLAVAAGVDRTRRDEVLGLTQEPVFDGEKFRIGGDNLSHLVIVAAMHFITGAAEKLVCDWIHRRLPFAMTARLIDYAVRARQAYSVPTERATPDHGGMCHHKKYSKEE